MRIGLTEKTNAWFPGSIDQNVSVKASEDSYGQVRRPLLFLLLVQVLLLRENSFALERGTFRDQLRDDRLCGCTFGLQLLDLVMLQCLIRGAVIAQISIVLSGIVRRCLVYDIRCSVDSVPTSTHFSYPCGSAASLGLSPFWSSIDL